MSLATTSTAWNPAEPDAIQCLQIVYKIAERCNLNCSYCYYFNMGDDTALTRPARASLDTSELLAQWLAEGCRELGIPQVHIAFHGGEPMLVRAESARICAAFERHLGREFDLRFSIQINGTLLTEGWIEALRQYSVSVGVSIDGMRADHDRYRLDHQNRSTFEATERAIMRLVAESATSPSMMPGTISESSWTSASIMRSHIATCARWACVRCISCCLICSADDASPLVEVEAARIGKGLLQLFRAWLEEDNPDVYIRFIREALAHFELGADVALGPTERKKNQVLVARSDGSWRSTICLSLR